VNLKGYVEINSFPAPSCYALSVNPAALLIIILLVVEASIGASKTI
jgi:hypothetical protein